jgi:hypothetical protein
MSNCIPCPPCEGDEPLVCEPYGTVTTGNRVMVEDDAFCTKTIANPSVPSTLTWDNGVKWEPSPTPIQFVQKSGDTMTGLLILSGDPSAALGATTKQYTDNQTATKVSKSGDTMTGLLVLSADPSAPLGAATKQYVDSADALKLNKAGDTMTGPLIVNNTISSSNTILVNGSSSKIGYDNGSGGSVIQGVGSKTNGVTIHRPTGVITTDSANLAANTSVGFNMNNTVIGINDIVIISHIGGGTLGAYNFAVTPSAFNAFITIRNITSGALAESLILRFFVIKSANV